ncbi:hypothetical protein GCM10023349_46930 [Nocardioides conyzicola]|uniref:Uncharacterized protein n=1 Tax=Nocardioides conyzicola TaxID=1651781 RepID=A0ABP8Y4R2_9ACTN
MLLSGAAARGSWSGVSLNSDPQPEGYSYVNLAVVTTVGTGGTQIVATRPRPTGLSGESRTTRRSTPACRAGFTGQPVKPALPYGFVVGCPGTLTS